MTPKLRDVAGFLGVKSHEYVYRVALKTVRQQKDQTGPGDLV